MGWADRAKKAAPSVPRQPAYLEITMTEQEASVVRDVLCYLSGRARRTPWSDAQEMAADVTINRLAAQFDNQLAARGR
jgi:hypothetical protein